MDVKCISIQIGKNVVVQYIHYLCSLIHENHIFEVRIKTKFEVWDLIFFFVVTRIAWEIHAWARFDPWPLRSPCTSNSWLSWIGIIDKDLNPSSIGLQSTHIIFSS